MARARRASLILAMVCGLAPALFGALPVAAAEQCFSETQRCMSGRFLDYWYAHGGLAINGYPLSNAQMETLEDGNRYEVQWFERVRMEYHPENPPASQVLLGQFGRKIHPPDPRANPKPGQRFFDETGHNLGGDFLAYWEANGGLPQFGFPLTEEFSEKLEDGQTYTVQYTERARFERHPGVGVLLGQFGRRILAQGGTPPAAWGPTLAALQGGTAYSDQSGRFTTRYPSGWNVVVDGDRNVNFLEPHGYAGINVSPRPVDDDMTIDLYRQIDYDYLLPRLRDYKLISDTKIMVGPYIGYKRVFTHTNLEGQFEMIVRYHFRAPGYVFVVNCFALPHDEALYTPMWDGTTGAIVAGAR